MLLDQYKRIHDYLRISLTDSCNFRCDYCMPEENISCMPNEQLMQVEEIEAIARTFVGLGVKKIRLTGGEPLVRKGVADIIRRLSKLPVALTLTTNGVLVDKYIDLFKASGIRSLNVSLDTLHEGKFFRLTKRDALHKVRENIQLLIKEGFHVKLNVVVMQGVNEDEINDFIALTRDQPLHVRFIEFMPFEGNGWNKEKVFTTSQMLDLAEKRFSFIKLEDEKHDTAKKFKVLHHQGTFAFITTMSAPFCGNCNRLRLTADGKMKNCLFSKGELDLLGAYRKGESLIPLIEKSLMLKAATMGGQFEKTYQGTDAAALENRSMIRIGG